MTVPQVNTQDIKTRVKTQGYHNIVDYIKASNSPHYHDEDIRYGDPSGLWSIDGHIAIIDDFSAGKGDNGFLRTYRVVGDTYPLRQQFYDAGWRWNADFKAYEITVQGESRWGDMGTVPILDRAKKISPFQSELAFVWHGVYLQANRDDNGAFGSWWANRALDIDLYFGQGTLKYDYRKWLFINRSNMFTDESKSLMAYVKSFIGRDSASLAHTFRDLEA